MGAGWRMESSRAPPVEGLGEGALVEFDPRRYYRGAMAERSKCGLPAKATPCPIPIPLVFQGTPNEYHQDPFAIVPLRLFRHHVLRRCRK